MNRIIFALNPVLVASLACLQAFQNRPVFERSFTRFNAAFFGIKTLFYCICTGSIHFLNHTYAFAGAACIQIVVCVNALVFVKTSDETDNSAYIFCICLCCLNRTVKAVVVNGTNTIIPAVNNAAFWTKNSADVITTFNICIHIAVDNADNWGIRSTLTFISASHNASDLRACCCDASGKGTA